MRTAGLVLRWLNRIESWIAAICYAFVAILLIGDVAGREILNAGIFGAQKMAVFAAIVAGFMGLALATAANTQLRPAFLDWVLPGPAAERLGDGFACIFYAGLAWTAFAFVQETFASSDRAAVLYWLLWPIQAVIPYALLSTAVRHGLFYGWPALKPNPAGAT